MVIPFPAIASTVAGELAGQVGDRLRPPSAPALVFRSETTSINPWWFVLGAFLVFVVLRKGKR